MDEGKLMKMLGLFFLGVGLIGGAGAIAHSAGVFHSALSTQFAPSLGATLSKVAPVATEAVGVAVLGYGAKTAFGK